jgi:hypothetical protein
MPFVSNSCRRTITSNILELSHCAGFLDGDGSFCCGLKRVQKKDGTYKYDFTPRIIAWQKQKRVFGLHILKERLGCGQVYLPTNNETDDMCSLKIRKLEDVKNVAQALQGYVKVKKEVLEIFLKLVDKLENLTLENCLETFKLYEECCWLNRSLPTRSYEKFERAFTKTKHPILRGRTLHLDD